MKKRNAVDRLTVTLSRATFEDMLRFLTDAYAEVTQRDDPDDAAWLEELGTLLAELSPTFEKAEG